MTTPTDIATQLGQLYRTRAGLSFARWQTEQDIERRKVQIIPPDGWPGSNAEARKANQAKAEVNDEALHSLDTYYSSLGTELAQVTGQIEALECERRMYEWNIRSRLADALAGKGDSSHPDSEFDTAADLAAVEELPF